MSRHAALALALAFVASAHATARPWQTAPAMRPLVAVFDVGDSGVRSRIARALEPAGLAVLDTGLVDAAARGAGYDGSLNMTLDEARRLGRTVGAQAFVLGTTSILERISDDRRPYWDAFVALFLADGGSGRLLQYRAFRATAGDRETARSNVLDAIDVELRSWGDALRDASMRREQGTLAPAWDRDSVELVTNPDGGPDVTPPRFFKRPAPAFTEDADRAHAVATVDLVVQFNADGTYGPVDVVRWAGFGLDESAIAAVRACRFWPARRNGQPVAARALLRYNFRFRER